MSTDFGEQSRLKGAVHMAVSRGLSLALQLASVPILLRVLGTDGFGAVGFVMSLAAFAYLLDIGFCEGTWIRMLRHTDPENKYSIGTLRKTHVVSWVMTGLAGGLCIALLGPLLQPKGYTGNLQALYASGGVFFACWCLHSSNNQVMMATKQFKALGAMSLLYSFGGGLISLGLAVYFRRPEWVLFGNACGGLMSGAYAFVYSRKVFGTEGAFSRELTREALRIGKKSYPNRALTQAMGQGDRLLLGSVSVTGLGNYNSSTRIAEGLQELAIQFRHTFQADISAAEIQGGVAFSNALEKFSRLILVMSLAMLVVPAGFGKSILGLWLGAEMYSEGATLFLCRSIYLSFENYFAIFGIAMIAAIKPHLHFRVVAWNALVTLTCTIPAYQMFGVVGLGYMNVALELLLFFPYLIMVKRSLCHEFPLGKHLRGFAILAGVGGAVTLGCWFASGSQLFMDYPILGVIATPFAMGLCILLCFATGEVDIPDGVARKLSKIPLLSRFIHKGRGPSQSD
jgi:O-antigen/teichoic acid export membrane protein